MSIETNFGLSNLKKDNAWFTLKSCYCAQTACQKVFKVIKVCIVASTMKLRFNVGVSKTL